MAKGKSAQKTPDKKKPELTLKEKRAAKEAKRQSKKVIG